MGKDLVEKASYFRTVIHVFEEIQEDLRGTVEN
jgi:hypothetical protein